jgi:hypothetical protein
MIVASDSRLTGGMTWDEGPKIFQLSRGDAVLAFAGPTYYAYPIIMQVVHAINEHDRSRDRSQSLNDLKGHLERLVQRHLAQIRDKVEEPDFSLVLAGYSAKYQRWQAWVSKIYKQHGFKFCDHHPLKRAIFVGDGVREARRRLMGSMPGKRHSRLIRAKFDWEPLDVLRDMIREKSERSVGGPIQIVKIYKHLGSMPYGVLWDVDGVKAVTVLGRSLLDYEKTQRLVLDPDSHRLLRTWKYLESPMEESET